MKYSRETKDVRCFQLIEETENKDMGSALCTLYSSQADGILLQSASSTFKSETNQNSPKHAEENGRSPR